MKGRMALRRTPRPAAEPEGEAAHVPDAVLRLHTAVLEAMSDAVVATDPEERVVYLNGAAERLYAVAAADALGRKVSELYRAEWVRPADEGAARAALAERGVWRGESVHHPSTGASRHVESTVTLLRDAKGQPGGHVAVIRDVTERQRMEAALRASQEQFRALAENAPDVIARFDADLRHVYANPAAERLSGVPRERLLGRTSEEIGLPRHVVSLWAARTRQVFETGEPAELEYRYDGREGPRDFEARLVPERGPGGEVRWVQAITRDVTERRRLEASLRDRERELRTLADNLPSLVTRVDRELRPVFVNAAAARAAGLPAERILGRTVRDLLGDPAVAAAWEERLRAVLEAGEAATMEYRREGPDGPRDYECTFTPERGPAGRVETILAISHDITERQRSQEALREADTKKNRFLAVLSHELRNPLAPIRNALWIQDRAGPGAPQALRAREVIDRQIEHLSRIVDDLLDVTRIATGKLQLRRERVDLGEVVRRAADDLRPTFARAGVALEVVPPRGPVPVTGDPTRLAQITSNLLQNAAKFTPSGGSARVAVAVERGEATLRVRDTGAGLSPEAFAHLFEPFMQADDSPERVRGGLGLGLTVVRGLAESHGGRVTAASEGAGRGAEFVVTLPLAEAGAAPAPSPRAAPPVDPLRILVVEDNPDAALTLEMVLQLEGHEVQVARDGRDGISRADAFRPDLVICDIGLPELDGYGVARALRATVSGRDVFLVALSGYAQPDDLRQSAAAGFDAHVAKPVSPERLRDLLRKAAERRSARR
jgi:PAS domain S-box-containing protein